MKTIDLTKNKVYYLSQNNWDPSPGSSRSFPMSVKCVQKTPRSGGMNKTYRVTMYTSEIWGLFLGPQKNLVAEINKHKYTGNPSTLFFAKSSKFPRAKATNVGKKRKLDPTKADVIVAAENLGYTVSNRYCYGDDWDHHVVYYNNVDSSYLIVPRTKGSWIGNYRGASTDLHTYVANTYGLSKDKNWSTVFFQEAVKHKVISSDYTEVYRGPLTALDDSLLQVINFIDQGMQIIYDTELDKIISPNQEKLDDDQLKQVGTMLDSPDVSVVGMAMKLLANTDYTSKVVETTMLLVNKWNNIRDNSVFSSVAFQQLLTALSLPTTKSSYIDQRGVFNTLYKKGDDEVKEKVRNLTVKFVEDEIKSIAKRIVDEYPDMRIVHDIKLT